ncbi:MAG: InlB B-repeat-containing protein [Sphaerochaeta sp.]|nr:InlB B-repeat-containing protein [Sphaerochaeta sp.]
MKKAAFMLTIICMVLFFLGCPVLTLEDLENPADPEAESYQGYLVVDNPSQIESHTQNGGRLSVPRFVVSKVVDAQSYQLQVANDEGFEDIVYDNTFTTNVLEPELPKSHLIRYWRARTKVDDSWGDWSSIQSFSYLHPQTVYFDSQGGSTPIIRHKEAMEGLLYGELPTAVHPAKAFDGWWGEPGGKGVQITAETPVATDEGHVVYAKWRGYLVDFNSQEGSIVAPIEDVIHGTGILEPATPTRSGYEFDGWYTESACLNEWDFSSDVVVSDISLYAKWNPASYTITFDRQGGSIPDPLNKNVINGQLYGALPRITRSGYAFGGWWTEKFGLGKQITTETMVSLTSNQILYADWNNPIIHHDDFSTDTRDEYVVSYNSNNVGSLRYSLGELWLDIYGWNGIQVYHDNQVLIPTYTEIIFKMTSFENNSQFILHWTEFGNSRPLWTQLNRMNSISLEVYKDTLFVKIIKSEFPDMDASGTEIFSEQYPIHALQPNEWHTIEIYRNMLEIYVLINGTTMCTVQIPENFLDLDMCLAFGVDSFDGSDVYVDELQYGYSY